MKIASREDRAWAAGFFDGEGCVSVSMQSPHSKYSYPKVTAALAQVHKGPLERFKGIAGMGNINGPYHYGGASKNPAYQLSICSFEGVQHLAVLLWPSLGSVKRNQFKLALSQIVQERRTRPHRKSGPRLRAYCIRGHDMSVTRTYRPNGAASNCKACVVVRSRARRSKCA